VLVVAVGEQNGGAQMERVAPEQGEESTLNPEVFEPGGIGEQFDRRNAMGEFERYIVAGRGIEVEATRFACENSE